MSRSLEGDRDAQDMGTLARGAGINLLALVSKLGRPAFYLLAARIYAAESYGLYFLAWTYVELAARVASFGLDKAILRHVAYHNALGETQRAATATRTALLIGGLISIGLSLVLYFRSTSIALLAGNEALSSPFHWLAFVIFFQTCSGLFLQVPVAHKIMNYQLYLKSLLEPALLIGFAILLSQLDTDVARLCQAHLLTMGIIFCLSIVPTFRLLPPRLWLTGSAGPGPQILRFSLPMFLADSIANLNARLDVFFLGYFTSPAVIGVYGIMTQLVNIVQSVRSAFDPIANPFFTELHARHNLHRLGGVLKIVTRWIVLLAIPVILLLVIYGRDIAAVVGRDYQAGYPWLMFLVLGATAAAFMGLSGYVLVMTGHPAILLRVNLATLFISGIGTLFLVRFLGPLGASIGTAFTLVLAHTLASWRVHRLHQVHAFSTNLWKPMLAGLFAGLLVTALNSVTSISPIWNILAHLPLLLASYCGLLLWFGLEAEERRLVSKVYHKARNIFGR